MNRIACSMLACALVSVVSGCGDENKVVPQHAQASPTPPPPAPPAPARDPDGVPDHGPPPTCAPSTGDARAMRQRLRTLERGQELVPPEAASLLEGCAATPREIARALEKAGKAIGRARAHDYAAAAAYYRRALEIDPSYVGARVSLAGARAKLGNLDGAMYQLDQIRASGQAGEAAMARVFTDGSLVALRLTPRFWTWAGNPVPEMVALLPGAAETPITMSGSALSFTPPLTIPGDVIYTRFSLQSPHYRTLMAAIHTVTGVRVTHPSSVPDGSLMSPWIANLSSIEATALVKPAAFRFGDGQVVLAIPLFAEFDGEPEVIGIIATGPEAGPYQIAQIVRPDSECSEPVMFVSGDRRVLGVITRCDGGDDPSSFSRCLFSGDAGRVVMRCGNGVTAVQNTVTPAGSGDDDAAEDEEPEDEEYPAD